MNVTTQRNNIHTPKLLVGSHLRDSRFSEWCCWGVKSRWSKQFLWD